MYKNRAIADFGRRAAGMSAKSSHSCGVGCQLFRIGFIPFTSAAQSAVLPAANFRGGYPATFAWVAAARLTQGRTPNLRVLKPKLRKRWRR